MPALLLVIGLVELAVAIMLFERWRSMEPPHTRSPRTRRTRSRDPERAPVKAPRFRLAGEAMRITLDLEVADPRSTVVQRMAREAALRAMDRDPTADEVVVHDIRGVVLARIARPEPLPAGTPGSDVPRPETPRRRGRAPRVVGALHTPMPTVQHDDVTAEDLHVEGRPLAQRFDLPSSVLSRLQTDDDAVELVRAILDAAGLRPQVKGDVITCGPRAVVVVDSNVRLARSGEAMSRAYLRFVDTGATSGLMVSFSPLNPVEVKRREMLAPALRHVSMAGVQRMADAVALGADPFDFASGPVVVRG